MLANSPPKPTRINTKVSRSLPTHVNGQYCEEYQYTELEFLGPATEFEHEELREDGWTGKEDGELCFVVVLFIIDDQLRIIDSGKYAYHCIGFLCIRDL